MTMTRLCTSTWVAARPTPGAAYMVSAMSRTSLAISGVNAVTVAATFETRIGVFGNGGGAIAPNAKMRMQNPIKSHADLGQ